MRQPMVSASTLSLAGRLFGSIVDHGPQLSIMAGSMPAPHMVELMRFDPEAGILVVKVPASEAASVQPHLAAGYIDLDIESQAPPVRRSRAQECLAFRRLPASATVSATGALQLECRLHERLDAVSGESNAESLPVHCLHGMQVEARLELYPGEFSIPGRLLSLSTTEAAVALHLDDSLALSEGISLPSLVLGFPNGESLMLKADIVRLRPFGRRHLALARLAFNEVPSGEHRALQRLRHETECELLYRAGLSAPQVRRSQLFMTRPGTLRDPLEAPGLRGRHQQRLLGIQDVARQLQRLMLHIRHHREFSEALLYDSVDTLIYRAHRDRKSLLFALGQLYREDDWVRQGVQVAGELACILVASDPAAPELREAVAGAFVHTLGKPMLISETLPSLQGPLSVDQAQALRGHSRVLLAELARLGWPPGEACREVIAGASERLDGSGYPAGCRGKELSPVVRLMAVIKALNVLTHERNGRQALTPLAAYRRLNALPEAYDREALIEVIRHRGPNPIGFLARYSGGFLAWILDTDNRGAPTRVKVVKNLAFDDAYLDTDLEIGEIDQIGRLETIVDPQRYRLARLAV
ncbi:MAG: HD-GYP domain-containing protein [Pseudomonadota bacterium]